ncbi:hypothetical protein CMI47_20065 [Candidatus Pacearchaeota archaeon]|nr:hypothetical protein [Candidatus Pacearchaeota archaeon]|tara:strand:+ start:5121 stop:7496 length:2376 start_codon:yes stop_codon:yes gene_type:complete
MARPHVEITQAVATVNIVTPDPVQETCIVGPAYHINDYPDDKTVGVHQYGNTGGFGDSKFVVAAAFSHAIEVIPYSTFDFDSGKHVVDITSVHKPKVFMEDPYAVIKEAAEADWVISTANGATNVFTSDSADIGATLQDSAGVNSGTNKDTAIVASLMPQVLHDADAAFLTLPAGLVVGDKVDFSPVGGIGGGDDKTYVIRAIIDDNHLHLTDDAGGSLNDMEGVIDPAAHHYRITNNAGNVNKIVVDADRGKRIRHTPVELVVHKVVTSSGAAVFHSVSNTLVQTGAHDDSGARVRFERKLTPPNGDTGFEIAAGQIDGTDADSIDTALDLTISGYKIARAKAYVEYRAIINNLADYMTFASEPATGFADIGRVDSRNPLAMGVAISLANSGGSKVSAFAVATDDTAGYTAVRAKLNSHGTVYCVVPMSNDLSNVIVPMKNDAEALALPGKSKYRLILGSAKELPTIKYVGPSLGGETDTGTFDAANLTDDDATFITDGVVSGDSIVITADTGLTDAGDAVVFPATYFVDSVVSENTVTVKDAGGAAAGAFAASSETATYTIQRSIATSAALQATELLATIKSAASPRLVMTYPATCTARGFTDQPGYYLSAALGGLIAGQQPHRPKNNTGVAGITQIFDSNLHFDYDQIDSLGDGGYAVFTQDSLSGLPYIVHQVTTGVITYGLAAQEFSEISVVNNFDYVSNFFKGRMTPYVGLWNVIPEAFGSLRTSLNSAILDLKGRSATRIGSPLISGTINSIAQSATDAGTVEIDISVTIPKVLNTLKVKLISS